MGLEGGSVGLVQASDYTFKPPPGITVLSGPDFYGLPLQYAPGRTTCHVFKGGARLLPEDYTATDGSSIILADATQGEEYTIFAVAPFNVANTFGRDEADARFNRRRNRNYDPGMRISQENGNNLLSPANGQTVYPSDGCAVTRSLAAGAFTVQRVASLTPGGSPYRVRFTCTAANPAPVAADYALIQFSTEGAEIADFRFGTIGARAVLKRIGLRSAVAGDISLALRNGAFNRAWIGKVTIQPGEVNTDVVKWVWFVGDQSGTWASDTAPGWHFSISLCAGSTNQGVAGWQAGSQCALPGAVNFLSAVGVTLDVFDVGSHDVSDITNPAPPRFELKTLAEDLKDCRRYYEKTLRLDLLPGSAPGLNTPNTVGGGHPSGQFRYHSRFRETKRISPACTVYDSNGLINCYSYYTTTWNGGGTLWAVLNPDIEGFYVGHNQSGSNETQFYYTANARML